MPPPSKISLMPREVRVELYRRIALQGFSGYVELAEWLSTQGFPVGKSALAEFAARNRDVILCDAGDDGQAVLERAAIRARCLEAAARLVPSDRVLATAEELLSWVYSG